MATDCFGGLTNFSNLAGITINDSINVPTEASPYPSTNYVSGLTGLVVAKATVTLHGFSHSFPSDVSMLLVSPQGQRAILMSEVGGQNQYSVTNLTITLDDDAPTPLPVYTSLTSGTFRPANGYLSLHYPTLPYDFPAPAPPGNSNSLSSLAVFKGTDPNGTWDLYVVDDAAGNAGLVSGGWTLSLDTAVQLSINRAQTNVVLAWTNVVSGCTLQGSANISGLWTNVLPVPVIVGGRFTVTNRLGNGSSFYRLVH
jgi:subtilisin-like proprotein convertase family protein